MGRAAHGGEDEEVTPGPGRWEALTAHIPTGRTAPQALDARDESSPRVSQGEANTGTEIRVRCAQSETNLTAALPELRVRKHKGRLTTGKTFSRRTERRKDA